MAKRKFEPDVDDVVKGLNQIFESNDITLSDKLDTVFSSAATQETEAVEIDVSKLIEALEEQQESGTTKISSDEVLNLMTALNNDSSKELNFNDETK